MATRSRIGLMLEDGTIKHSYCHFDGYPNGVGHTLVENYSDIEKIEEYRRLDDDPLAFMTEQVHRHRQRVKHIGRAQDRALIHLPTVAV